MANCIIWSPRAAFPLQNICEFIAEDSPVYARIFAQKIYGDDRVIYRIVDDGIEIAAICHGARQLERVFSEPG